MRRKIRLKDVAERAGVAVNTASTILNRRTNSWASKETVERVFAAAKELGYRPNRTARALQSGRFNAIGILLRSWSAPSAPIFVEELNSAFHKKNLTVTTASSKLDLALEQSYLDNLVDLAVDGAILWLSDIDRYHSQLTRQTALGLTLVALAKRSPDNPAPIDTVIADLTQGLQGAFTHLQETGHDHYVLLCGLVEGLEKDKIRRQVELLIHEYRPANSTVEFLFCPPTANSAHTTLTEHLASGPLPPRTALIVLDESSTLGAMRACIDAGLSIPLDLSVIGTGDNPMFSLSPVSISAIQIPFLAMAAAANDLLTARLEKSESAEDSPPQQVLLPTRFVPRESCAPRVRNSERARPSLQ